MRTRSFSATPPSPAARWVGAVAAMATSFLFLATVTGYINGIA